VWVTGSTTPAHKDCLKGPFLSTMTFHAKAHNVPFYQKRKCCGINASRKFYILGEYT